MYDTNWWEEQLAVYVSDGIPEMLIGDPGRFRQIITNLVGNSVKVSTCHLCLTSVKSENDRQLSKTLFGTANWRKINRYKRKHNLPWSVASLVN